MAAYRSQAQHLIYPEPAPRTRDHHKENIRDMRQKQQALRNKQMQDQRDKQRPAFRNRAMDNVQARVQMDGHAPANFACAKAPVEKKGEFLKAGARKPKGPPKAPVQPYQGREKKLAPVPTREEAAQAKGGQRGNREDRDFEKQALKDLEAIQQKKKREEQLKKERLQRQRERPQDFGKVPDYLGERKQELAEEKLYMEQMVAKPDLPPGWQEMPNETRKEILHKLQEAFAKKSVALQRMPLVCEGIGRQRAKTELEAEIQECERSIATFSQKVYIDPRGNLTNRAPQQEDSGGYGADRWERPLQ